MQDLRSKELSKMITLRCDLCQAHTECLEILATLSATCHGAPQPHGMDTVGWGKRGGSGTAGLKLGKETGCTALLLSYDLQQEMCRVMEAKSSASFFYAILK